MRGVSPADPSTAEVLDAISGVLAGIEAATQPNPAICLDDGCLIITGGPCPACELRTRPRRCECGRRLKHLEAELCWVCLRQARMRAQRFCGCGKAIRTDAEECYRCRQKPPVPREFDRILGTIWFRVDDDPHRFSDLLADALGFIGALAIRTDHHVAERAAGLLRRMEQRALRGPDHEHEDHR